MFPIQDGYNYNISAPIVFMVHALLLSIIGAAAWIAVRGALRRGNGSRPSSTLLSHFIAAAAILHIAMLVVGAVHSITSQH